MQRSKAAVSVEVKRVIGALCRLLAAVGLRDVPVPETFRRAKFGGEAQVENQLWQLLANILQASSAASSQGHAHETAAPERRKLVAAGLWRMGYYADWMYEQGEEDGGLTSRDLLLALGWLLASGSLETLLTRRVQQLDRTLLPAAPMNPLIAGEFQVESPSLRRLQWLIGRLRHQGRSLLSVQEERARLLHAVHSASVSNASSSSADQSSSVLREDCVAVRQLCDLLQAFVNWKQVEKVFWTWMDSVVDCHVKDSAVGRPTLTVRRSMAACRPGDVGLERLEDVLLRLDAAKIPLSQAYRARLQAGGAQGQGQDTGLLSASQAIELLHHTEAQLLEGRDAQRLANRSRLQDMIGRLEQLVLIAP
ncbi:tubulin epsilon and delta complex protein 1 isoform 2-T2 [Aulostomus maculatus]